MKNTPWPSPVSLHLRLLAILCLLLAPSLGHALGGTGADPILETEIDVTLHVDAGATGPGDGSAGAPFNDVQQALNVAFNQYNANGTGVRVLFAPGTYRIGDPSQLTALQMPSPSTSAPVVLEGAGWAPGTHTGDVILSGSEVWTGWNDQGDGTWTAAWPYDWGIGINNTGGGSPPEAMLRYESVHVDGSTYFQLLGPTDPHRANLAADEGAFWVDEASDTLTLLPPAGAVDISASTVEVTTGRRLLHHWRPQAETSATNVAFRNLVFQHGSGGMNSGAVLLQNMIGLTIEDCVFRDNKQMGLTVSGQSTVFTLRGTDIIRNGEMGGGHQAVDALIEDVSWDHNGRFADITEYYGWGYGGVKIGHGSNMTFRRVSASHNYGIGLWFDTGCVENLVVDSWFVGNSSQGLWSENNNRNSVPALGARPTVVLRNSYLSGNRRRSPQANVEGGGFYITEAENSVIEHSVLYNNNVQFRVSDGPGRGPTANTLIRDSVLASAQGAVDLIYSVGYGVVGWTEFFDTLSPQTDRNTYYYSGSSDGIHPLSPQPQPATTAAFLNRNQQLNLDLAGWQTTHSGSGADQASIWTTDYHGQALVHIQAVRPVQAEDGGTVDALVVSRAASKADLQNPLTVHLSYGGIATPGTHYQSLPTSIQIPAGEHRVAIPFTPIERPSNNDGSLTITATVDSSSDYVTSPVTAEFALEDSELSGQTRVSVVAESGFASEEGPTAANFLLTRIGDTSGTLAVDLSFAGTAAAARYADPGTTAIFESGASETRVEILPVDDSQPQLTETVVLNIENGSGYSLDPNASTSASIDLLDNDVIQPVTLSLSPGAAAVQVPVTLHNPDTTQAQTFTIQLPDNTGYSWSDSTQPGGPAFQWTELEDGANGSTRINQLNGSNNSIASSVPIGFDFPLYGQTYNQLRAANDGVLYLGSNIPSATDFGDNNRLIPDPYLTFDRSGIAAIAFFWDDLAEVSDTSFVKIDGQWQQVPNPDAGSTWYAQIDADTFVIQYQDHAHYVDFPNLKMTTQVTLKSSGEITIAYQESQVPTQLGATVGIQGEGATNPNGLTVSHNSDYIQGGMAVRIQPAVTWLTASGNPIQVTVPAGSTANFDLSIDPSSLSEEDLYTAVLSLSSDHPSQPDLQIPVELTISAGAGPPAAPTGLAADTITADWIDLDWTDAADNENGYRIERATNPAGPFTELASLAEGSTSYRDSSVLPESAYHYRVVAFNDSGEASTASLPVTTPALQSPPAIVAAADFGHAAATGIHWIQTDQEIRAHFEAIGGVDDVPGTAGAGWLDAWSLQATGWQTVSTLSAQTDAPLWPGGGRALRLEASNTGAGKRSLVARSYGDDPARRIALNEPHRITVHLAVEDISGFASTSDRLYLWDRNQLSSDPHYSAPETMSWGFLTGGSSPTWLYFGPNQVDTGIALSEGHRYRFVIEIDPANHRWQFELTDLDTGASYSSPDWHDFRNAGQLPGTVGGHLHAGTFLDSYPQSVRLSLDGLVIRASDITFSSPDLPAGWTLDPATGLLAGTAQGSERFAIQVQNDFGSTVSSLAHGPFSNWQDQQFDSADLLDPNLRASHWGKTADPDNDGLSNLLEYALGMDPAAAGGAPLGIVPTGSGLALEFYRARSELNYLLESSPDLQAPWTQEALNPGNPGETIVVPVAPGSPSAFYRLRVSE